MIAKLTKRFLTEVDFRILLKFAYNSGWKGIKSVNKFKKRVKKGEYFPPFIFISVTNRCNLLCQGCWVLPTRKKGDMSTDMLDKIITESKQKGTVFFGILGGEPLLHEGITDIFKKHSDCYFLLFTNGLLIGDSFAQKLRKAQNVSPLISIEGDEFVSDVRRGGKQVYVKSLQGVRHCVQNKLITGVATSVCKSNFKELVSERFIEELIKHRVHYFWYYIYRPVGANPNPDLCLSEEEILELRRFMVKKRRKFPILLIDSYWDALGNAMCPAATGISYHINPFGDIEPCPPVQIASNNVSDDENVYSSIVNSELLKDFRKEVPSITRGCLLLENPDYLIKIKEKSEARDTTGRQSFEDELKGMEIRSGHHIAGKEIPEEYWPYKFAKKHWFFGFGAYG